jgi:hypothetical protein
MPAGCIVPNSVFVPDYMFDQDEDLDIDVKLKEDDDSHSFVSYDKTRLTFAYDNDTASLTSVESPIGEGDFSQVYNSLDNSAGNAFSIASEIECCKLESNGFCYTCCGQKIVIPKQESPVTLLWPTQLVILGSKTLLSSYGLRLNCLYD